jgi:hypothetical protein
MMLVIAGGIGYLKWNSVQRPLRELEYAKNHRTAGDSAYYASTLYHATYAMEDEANRWGPAGYATLTTIGLVIGVGLIASAAWRRRPQPEPAR